MGSGGFGHWGSVAGYVFAEMGHELARAFQSRWAAIGCLVVVVLALVLPKGGAGLPLCQFKAITHLPCLGCGLTRSFIGMAHLRVGEAVFYHPFGAVLFPLVVLIAGLGAAPKRVRERMATWAERNNSSLTRGAWALLIGAVVYGLIRIGWVLATPGQASPW